MDWMLGAPKLPKVVKVNHRAHIHPLAREASQSAKQRRAAKTNTRRSPGRPFFRGRLRGSWSDRSRVRHSWAEFRTRREEGRRCYRLSMPRHWNHRGVLAERVGGTPDRSRRCFPSRRLRLLIWKWSDYGIGWWERKGPEGQRWECMATKVFWLLSHSGDSFIPFGLFFWLDSQGRESNSWTWRRRGFIQSHGNVQRINWLPKQSEKRRFCLY